MIYDDAGNVARQIQTVRDSSGNITQYVVTVHRYIYRSNDPTLVVMEAMDGGHTTANVLSGVQDFQPFVITVTDPSNPDPQGLRYTQQPTVMVSEQRFNTDPDAAASDAGMPTSATTLGPDGARRMTTYASYVHGWPQITIDVDGNATFTKYDTHTGSLVWTLNATGEGTRYEYSDGTTSGVPAGLIIATYAVRWDDPANPSATPAQIAAELSAMARLGQMPSDPTTLWQLTANAYYPDTNIPAGRSAGQLASSTDFTADPTHGGKTTSYQYDALGDATRTYHLWTDPTDSGNRRWVVDTSYYDALGRETSTSEATYTASVSGVLDVNTASLDANGNGVITDTPVVAEHMTAGTFYDVLGRPYLTLDPLGNATLITYDADGNVISTINPDHTETRTAYDAMGRAAWTTDRFASTSSFTFDSTTGEVSNVTYDNTSAYVVNHTLYDSLGRTIGTERYKDATIAITADPVAIGALSATSPDAPALTAAGDRLSTTSTVYDDAGRVTSSTSADGTRTGTTYYADGRVEYAGLLKTTAAPTGPYAQSDFVSYATYAYDLTDNLPDGAISYDSITDPRGHTTKTYRDALGRTIETLYDDGSLTQTIYGREGLTASYYDPTNWNNSTPRAINGTETVNVSQHKAGTTTAPAQYTEDFADEAGRLTDVYQPQAAFTTTDGNGNGNAVITGTGTALPHWSYGYDVDGNETGQTDPNGHTTTWTFDELGHELSRTLPSDGATPAATEHFTYDTYGRLLTHEDFKQQWTNENYDALGRLVEEDRWNASATQPTGRPDESTVTHYDDPLGRRSEVDEYAGSPATGTLTQKDTWSYDSITGGVTMSDTQLLLNGTWTDLGAVNHAYDAATGRLSRTWTADGANDTGYGYDAQGRLWHVTSTTSNNQPGAGTITYAYDLAGNLASVTLPSGDATSYTYDALNRLTDERTTTASGTLLSEYAYTLRDDGLRDHVIETTATKTAGVFSTTRIDWQYDALGRLIREQYDGGDDGVQNGDDYTATYAFDLANNRTQYTVDKVGTSGDDVITYALNARDEVTAETSQLTGTTLYGYDANGSQTSKTNGSESDIYTWDLRNRMSGATVGGVSTTYAYDAGGYRVAETTGTGGAATTRTFLKDDANPSGYPQALEERLNGTLDRSYVLGLRVEAQTDGEGIAFLLRDGHGSVTQLVGAAGNLIADDQGNPLLARYDAFGTVIGTDAAAGAIAARTTQGFGGDGVTDSVVGLTYHDARFRQGYRFISMDSYGGQGSDPLSLHKSL